MGNNSVEIIGDKIELILYGINEYAEMNNEIAFPFIINK